MPPAVIFVPRIDDPIVIVGVEVYPVPAFVIVRAVTTPPDVVAVAVAPVPPPPLIVTCV